MKSVILGLGLFLSVSFLDIGQGAWAYDLAAAQRALKAKNYDQVIQLLSGEIEKLNREGLFVLAKAYSTQKKHEAAIKAYNACLSLNPKDFEAKTLIGAEQMVSGKDKEALATLKEALETNPQFVPAYKLLIRYYEKKKNKYEQRLLYEDLIAKVGETTQALTKLCELTTQDRLYDLAARHCQKGILRDPKIPDNYVNLGIVHKETGESEKAEENLKKAAQEFPKSLFAQMTYAQFLDERKNYIFSFNYYKRATEADSKSVPALLGLANSAIEIQKYADSLAAFEKACTLDRTTLPAFRRAANSLRTMKAHEWLKKFEQGIETCS
jgi:tetratricopeptide (TPR) repeat protein